jgi:hypothetical protein
MGTYIKVIVILIWCNIIYAQPILPTYRLKILHKVESKLGALDRYKSFTSSLVIIPIITWTYANYTWETHFEFEYQTNISDTNWIFYTATTNMYLLRPTNSLIFLRMRAYHKSLNYYSPYATVK